ncbi:hypothetical protein [Bradyrhizobium sp. AZCC 2262]|uniref:hypothetical protein n=1 Tax=Bradyrhizobium sp. AZCC 2262 TaxID=3117022 RepID=UPI002FF0E975
MRAVVGSGLGEPGEHTVGRRDQGIADQVRPGVFDILRQGADHQNNRIVAAAKDTLGLDAEPLRPDGGDEVPGKARARDLPIAFDRNAGGALAGGSRALDHKIVCKPAQVASLPLHAVDFTEIRTEPVGPGQEIEKKARGNAVLIAEAGSGSELNGSFLLRCGLRHRVVPASRTFREHLQWAGRRATAFDSCH